MLFDQRPEQPKYQDSNEWSLGCLGIVLGIAINFVVLFAGLTVLDYLPWLSRLVGQSAGLAVLAMLLIADAVVIFWGFKKKESSFVVGLVIAACLTFLLYSQCGFN